MQVYGKERGVTVVETDVALSDGALATRQLTCNQESEQPR